ncbi:MAG: hypothetical protein Q8873_09150, partial [Bacillota bacterium]|nr:hypothetical protein [Bacillota bacterium]
PQDVKYTKITIDWYDANDWTLINEEEKQLKTLIFTYENKEYKISLGDILRGGPVIGSYQNPIFWDSPQQIYSLSDDEWYQIQHYSVWIGMTKEKFLLTQVYTPDRVITRYFSYGRRDQYTYVNGLTRTDYYLKNGILDSWKRTDKKS